MSKPNEPINIGKQEKLTNQKLLADLAFEVRPGVYYKITKK